MILHAHTSPTPTNNLATYQLPAPYSFHDIQWIRIFKGLAHYSKVKGQMKVKEDIGHLHPPHPESLPSMNFIYITVSEIQLRQNFTCRPSDRLTNRPPA